MGKQTRDEESENEKRQLLNVRIKKDLFWGEWGRGFFGVFQKMPLFPQLVFFLNIGKSGDLNDRNDKCVIDYLYIQAFFSLITMKYACLYGTTVGARVWHSRWLLLRQKYSRLFFIREVLFNT